MAFSTSAILYDEPDFRGVNITVPENGIVDLREKGYNDIISSITIKGPTPLACFYEEGYSGRMVILQEGKHSFLGRNEDNVFSSCRFVDMDITHPKMSIKSNNFNALLEVATPVAGFLKNDCNKDSCSVSVDSGIWFAELVDGSRQFFTNMDFAEKVAAMEPASVAQVSKFFEQLCLGQVNAIPENAVTVAPLNLGKPVLQSVSVNWADHKRTTDYHVVDSFKTTNFTTSVRRYSSNILTSEKATLMETVEVEYTMRPGGLSAANKESDLNLLKANIQEQLLTQKTIKGVQLQQRETFTKTTTSFPISVKPMTHLQVNLMRTECEIKIPFVAYWDLGGGVVVQDRGYFISCSAQDTDLDFIEKPLTTCSDAVDSVADLTERHFESYTTRLQKVLNIARKIMNLKDKNLATGLLKLLRKLAVYLKLDTVVKNLDDLMDFCAHIIEKLFFSNQLMQNHRLCDKSAAQAQTQEEVDGAPGAAFLGGAPSGAFADLSNTLLEVSQQISDGDELISALNITLDGLAVIEF